MNFSFEVFFPSPLKESHFVRSPTAALKIINIKLDSGTHVGAEVTFPGLRSFEPSTTDVGLKPQQGHA